MRTDGHGLAIMYTCMHIVHKGAIRTVGQGFATSAPGSGDTNLNDWEAPFMSVHIVIFFETLKKLHKLAL
jgi:hypothetical protein